MEMSFSSFKLISNQDIQYSLHKIRCYGEKLWTAALHSGIAVFNTQCQEVQWLKDDRLKFVCGLAQLNGGDLIVADTESGLMHLDKEGPYWSTIMEGRFSDVVIYEDLIYSLQWNNHMLYVHRYNCNDYYKKVLELRLEFENGFWGDKLAVNASHIVVGSWTNHCICIYSIDGVFLYKTGERGFGSAAGMLERPYVCDMDSGGNVLVCDWGNHRLQVIASIVTSSKCTYVFGIMIFILKS